MLNHNITHIARNPVAVASILTRHWGSLKKNISLKSITLMSWHDPILSGCCPWQKWWNKLYKYVTQSLLHCDQRKSWCQSFRSRTQLVINNLNMRMGYPPGTANVFPSRPDQFRRRWRGVRYCTPEDGVPPGYLDALPSNFFSSGPSWPWHTGSSHASSLAVLGPFSLRAARCPSFPACHSPPGSD